MARSKDKARQHVCKDPMGFINQPDKTARTKQTYDRIACVFQGGGALGAYQVGAFKAIHEHGYRPNYFAGVSIGSINSAIIAGNPPDKQIEKLYEFWNTVTPDLFIDHLYEFHNDSDWMHHFKNQAGALHAIMFGIQGFFKPRLAAVPTPLSHNTPDKLSYYDTSDLRDTLERLIDFDRINDKAVTLCMGAVNVKSGEMEFFNNQLTTITVDHILASCALPPGFPAVKIGPHYYWDGGIYANTPLVTVLDALPEMDTLCFMVDCFSLKGCLPMTMDQLEERQKDIRYASHSRRLTNIYASRNNLQSAIHYLGGKLTPEQLEDPEIQKILQLGHKKRFSAVHIIYNDTPFSHSFKDYNFIRSVIDLRLDTGYKQANKVLSKPVWMKQSDKPLCCSIYGVTKGYFSQH